MVTHGLLYISSTGDFLPPPICMWYSCSELQSILHVWFRLVYLKLANVANSTHADHIFKGSLPYMNTEGIYLYWGVYLVMTFVLFRSFFVFFHEIIAKFMQLSLHACIRYGDVFSASSFTAITFWLHPSV